jgi:prophage regulatory protein
MATDLPPDDHILREPDVERKTGLSRTTIWRLERKNEFPRRLRLSANTVGWLASEIQAWMVERSAAR